MKAAVLKQLGAIPVYEDIEDPVPSGDEVLMHVHAAALKNIDKSLASGKHYASYKKVPVIVGLDGVGTLEDGTKVYAKGRTGTLAEKTIISQVELTRLPEDLDWDTAAALPNAALGSYLPLMVKGKLKKRDTVLINGGTGVTGKLAIQLAKHYGAGRVIVTGHTEGREDHLKQLGADELISTQQEDRLILGHLKQIDRESHIRLVIDYLWGRPIELIIKSLFREGGNAPEEATTIVSVGALSGDEISLSSNNLRSGKTEITGAGLGSYTREEFQKFNREILPELFQLAAEGRLKFDLQKEKLEDIEAVWTLDGKGKRIVVRME